MTTATQRPVSLRVGDFQVESLGVEWPDYFQGYGLGPRSKFNYCAYGIGDTEEEAFQIVWKWWRNRVSTLTMKRKSVSGRSMAPLMIRKPRLEYLGVEEETDETPFFHVGIKWNCREEERLERDQEACQPGIAPLSGLLPARPLFALLGASGVGLHAPYRPR